jgi:hypothetical protein
MDPISKPLISEHLQRKKPPTPINRLDDKRNWISEWAKIKKSIPENFVKKLKSDENEKIKKSLGL